jgi:hypothetical protein
MEEIGLPGLLFLFVFIVARKLECTVTVLNTYSYSLITDIIMCEVGDEWLALQLCIRMSCVQILAQRLAILTEVSQSFPQSLQETAG